MSNHEKMEERDHDPLEKKGEAAPVVSGFLFDSKIRVYRDNKHYYYENGYFGAKENDFLELANEEALLLMERGKLRLYEVAESHDTQELESTDTALLREVGVSALTQKIAAGDPTFWGRYLVYKDLRARGYVIRTGFPGYRRYPRGAKTEKTQSTTIIFPFAEGTKLELSEFEQLVQHAHANRKQLVLGIVDRSGDITYYKA
ncbi:MAG TPA: hypothetical protein VJ044_19645, partial [Candidatus Hodarchaeales archaeon]|nr:hypothetical protein [Candidatus Hodarchaeales archaeon]